MCGAFTTPAGWNAIDLQPDDDWAELEQSFAVRPFDSAVIVSATPNGIKAGRADQWSLIPPFAKERRLKYSTFNARLDKLQSSAVWRTAFPKRRCLVPVNGFFERVAEKGATKKRPFYIQHREQNPFCFAGLWSLWHDEEDKKDLLTFTVITTEPNDLMKEIGHHRMPCIVESSEYQSWLDPNNLDEGALTNCIRTPFAGDALSAYAVGYDINYRDRKGAETIKPL